jgi:hypothetical protein
VSPTAQVSEGNGAVTVATGAWLPGLTTTLAIDVAPWLSVTRKLTVICPADV